MTLLALACAFCLLSTFAPGVAAQTILYDDGAWVVTGLDAAAPGDPVIDVAVAGSPVGSFGALTVARYFAGNFPVIYTVRADGGLQPVVPPNGVPGGTFYLTTYQDCFAGGQSDLQILTLNIQPNAKNLNALKLTGSLSNGATLQAGDLALRFDLPPNAVRLNVRYTLIATSNLCVDPDWQYDGEGFLVARMSSNYLSNDIGANDGARMKGYLDQMCGCGYDKGWICANFSNETGYIFPYQAWMADKQVFMRHSRLGPANTPALRIDLKSPSRSQCSVQGWSDTSADPAADNVNLWINWDFPKYQYAVGQRIRKFHFDLIATPPTQDNCDLLLP